MRTQLLFAMALVCGADVALAQGPTAAPPLAAPPLAGPPLTGAPVVGAPSAPVTNGQVIAGPAGPSAPNYVNAYPYLYSYYASMATAMRNFPSVPAVGEPGATRPEPYWAAAGFQIAWIRSHKLPGPVITSGSNRDTPNLEAALGQPGTRSLFGPDLAYDPFYGFFVEGGAYLDNDRFWSVDLRAFWQFENNVSFSAQSDDTGTPIIARPVFNVLSQREARLIIAFPGQFSGHTQAESSAEQFGFEMNLRSHSSHLFQIQADALVGFRYLHFGEKLTIRDSTTPVGANTVNFAGTTFTGGGTVVDEDRFQGTNDFYGGQIGLRVGYGDRWYYGNVFGKLALGVTTQKADIGGVSTLTNASGMQSVQGGVLALPSNAGMRYRNVFGIVPEFGFNAGVFVTERLRVTVGYSVLIWNGVVRPGDLIDRGVSPGQLPGATQFGLVTDAGRPAFRFNDSFFHTQFLNLGAELHF